MNSMYLKERSQLDTFQDILRDRRTTSDFLWASRAWNPASVCKQNHKSNSDDIKTSVLISHQLKEVISELSEKENVPPEVLYKTVKKILDEIGYERVVPVLRWLGFFTAKILKKLCSQVLVNEEKILRIKSELGRNPVLIVPSHRSYGDFILMSYLFFHFDLDIPRIAAGMDFHSMTFMGRILRDSCAFFMRRSFTSDKLYATVFSLYVQSLVINGDSSVEFFIEGTRSRTAKSLMPKYGFLSMALKPFFIGLVPDITILPVNLSYDRTVEELLFVYELLGVPKPKESTKGFFKALSILNESCGKVYINFGEPFSVKEFLGGETDRSIHNIGAIQLQQLTSFETKQVIRLAHSIVSQQQNLTVLTCFNLTATIINHHIMDSSYPLELEELVSEITWLLPVVKGLGACVAIENDVTASILQNLDLHKSLVFITSDRKIKLLRNSLRSSHIDKSNLKGHCLSNTTIEFAVPILLIQYYSNPCAHFLVNLCFILLIIQYNEIVSRGDLIRQFKFLRKIFSHEFALSVETEEKDFKAALDFAKNQKAVVESGSDITRGENIRLCQFCSKFFRSYIPSYLILIDILLKESKRFMFEKDILKTYQEVLESLINKDLPIHPASLSLDLAKNAMNAFTLLTAVTKLKRKNDAEYEIHHDKLEGIRRQLGSFKVMNKLHLQMSQHFSNFLNGKL